MRVNPHPAATQSRRRRPPLSCERCRRRKVKCNRLSPCNQCLKSGSENSCSYLPILEKENDHGVVVSVTAPAADTRPDDCSSSEASQSNPPQAAAAADILNGVPDTKSTKGFFESLPKICFRGKEGRTRFFGRSHWVPTLVMFTDIMAYLETYRQTKSKCPGVDHAVYKSMKRLKQQIQTQLQDHTQICQQLPASRLEELIPPREQADELVQLYLSTFATTFCVLDIPRFREEYEAFWTGREKHLGSPDAFVAKLLALMACVGSLSSESIAHVGHGWIYATLSWILSTNSYTSLSLDMIQIKCLLLIARQAIAYGGDLAWISASALLREAMAAGLHRDPSKFAKVSKPCAALRRRLWWTIIELDLQTSLDNGVPPSISCDEFDCPLPSVDIEEGGGNEDDEGNDNNDDEGTTGNIFQIALSYTLPARMNISKTVNGINMHLEYDEVLRLSKELLRDLRKAPPGLRIDQAPGRDGPFSDFQKSLFRFLTYRVLLVLHRPFVLAYCDTPDERFLYSRMICRDASLALLAQLDASSTLDPDTPPAYPYLLRLRGGMFCDEIFHAALMICLECRLQSEDETISPLPGIGPTLPGLLHANSPACYQNDAVLLRVENTIRYFEHKVQTEKRACKSLVFLNMALASATWHLSRLQQDQAHPAASREVIAFIREASNRASQRCHELLLAGWTSPASPQNERESTDKVLLPRGFLSFFFSAH
ncbi:hypothetical protein ASPZODRAFT_58967 [Penicilliopsis zonata CBS 506.65]|uniref:Zn(2)-C6 fungal-type domain-containing protein n=1 Tax=Penicilliopsis zonata CBS 506.65 TaxID=1073090 RepID=A0A1L9SSM6_9EURO|nr:hypothetical protein ASPZODRAFT_58967 [Penicilliopsis zonata CBS 506.65]OJJ50114.1 hypothetical protein ASPZODRAFT_58967 [Penicilliopsis zonata CBS 506.65]